MDSLTLGLKQLRSKNRQLIVHRLERPEDVDLRKRLRLLLKARGLTLQDVADHIEVHRCSVSKVLTGTNSLPPAWVPDLCRLIAISPEQLLQNWTPGRIRKRRRRRPKKVINNTVGPLLAELMRQRNVGATQLAHCLGVSRVSIYKVRAGRMRLPAAWTPILSARLGVDHDYWSTGGMPLSSAGN